MRTPEQVSAAWAEAAKGKAGNYRSASHDPVEQAREDYISGRCDLAEFESRLDVALGLAMLRIRGFAS